MIRKITLLLLLLIGLHSVADAQVRDSVTISMPAFTDTTCPGTQLTFVAVQSEDTFTAVNYHWYTNNVYTGVFIDTFRTSALSDGDSVFCMLTFTNSFGFADSSMSNVIYIYRRTGITPRVIVSLIAGSNPDCAGSPLTFQAYPVNGGLRPHYQWKVNGTPAVGDTNLTFTRIFGGTDTVSCEMVSSATIPCAPRDNDTVQSNKIPIIHIHLTAGISITTTRNPICYGTRDTFTATLTNPGTGFRVSWYVDSAYIPGAVGNVFITDSLRAGSRLVYCVLTTPDSCIVNDTVVSNVITMTVIPRRPTAVSATLIQGSNPGCLDSFVTFQGTYSNFGTAPSYSWYINGVQVAIDTTIFRSLYANGDLLTFKVYATDNGCYTSDTLTTPAVLMIRDSTPPLPWISLIGNVIVATTGGHYTWYYSTTNTYSGTLIPGATGQVNHPTAIGYYYCVRDTGNCFSLPSNIIYISLLKVNELSKEDVKIYPNPTTGILNLDFGGQFVNRKMDIYNMVGQGLVHQEINNKSHYETDLSYLPEGNYIVVLRNEEGSSATYRITLSK